MGLGYVDFLSLQVTVLFQIQGGIQRGAVVGLVRRHEAGQTQALVGAFRVDALGILAERHPVVQFVAFVHICNKPNHTGEPALRCSASTRNPQPTRHHRGDWPAHSLAVPLPLPHSETFPFMTVSIP